MPSSFFSSTEGLFTGSAASLATKTKDSAPSDSAEAGAPEGEGAEGEEDGAPAGPTAAPPPPAPPPAPFLLAAATRSAALAPPTSTFALDTHVPHEGQLDAPCPPPSAASNFE